MTKRVAQNHDTAVADPVAQWWLMETRLGLKKPASFAVVVAVVRRAGVVDICPWL